jgi:hypothetical protein
MKSVARMTGDWQRLLEILWRYSRNPNAKAQMANKVQMSKFKGHTAGSGDRGRLDC